MSASLSRKIVTAVAAVLAAASLVFLVLFVSLYRAQLEEERSMASERINRLLQASLENAMVKRDLDGLRGIVNRLGLQDGISGVMILNPDREVRFASDEAMLGQVMADESFEPHTRFTTDAQGREVLRSVNPVRNKEVCQQCHGEIADNPVNGVLFVDYDAAALRGKAMSTALTLGASGVAVLMLVLALLTWVLQRLVVVPLHRLSDASQTLSAGDLSVRVDVAGDDEVGQLARTFNGMAQSLQDSMAAIRRRDQFQQALLDAIPDGIRVIDTDFTIVAANTAYATQVAQTVPSVVGRPCYCSSHQRDSACAITLVTCPVHELSQGGAPIKTVHQHIRPNGEPFFVEISAAPMMVTADDGSTRTLVVESIRDMSADIEISHGQRLSEVAQLATGIAHEIRNPLVAIRMALEGILRKGGLVDGGTIREPEKLARYLELVRDQMESCIGVSERLLNLTHFPAEGPELVDVCAALEDAEVLLAYEATVENIAVRVSPPPAETHIFASGPELRMVMVNLMQNAFHAMPNGGTLSIDASIIADPDTHAQRIAIQFKDSGVGIAPDAMSRIFDPYSTRRADGVEGTGMGLTICKNIVESYDGTITAQSQVGVGTTFTIAFPLA
jgi:signal transduction histidine kinase/HAMP domain-containing protein